MPHAIVRLLFVTLLCLAATSAAAQMIPGWETKQFSFERIDADRIRLAREVEVNGVGPNAGQQIFADDLEWNVTTGQLSASGNVLLVTLTGRIAAERVVFNTKTGLGTFHTASGTASLGTRALLAKSMFGTLEPDIMFYGETIEKTAEDRYEITRGGFTTCVQPTPRWEIVTGKATIKLEDYAILRGAVIRVKDVPVFYLPVLYYPIQSDDRATGFLLPTYGSSTYRGQSISNAFFWAMNRSQDATVFHDWFFGRSQGAGAEYRYAAAPGAEGQLRGYWLNEGGGPRDTRIGVIDTQSRRSFEMRGTLVQPLPGGVAARASVDYFSDITTKQLYNNSIYDSTLGRRGLNASLSKNWSRVRLSGVYLKSETFYSPEQSVVNGSAPSVSAGLSSQQLGRLPIFVAATADANKVVYLDRNGAGDTLVETDRGLTSFETSASVRAPFATLSFLTATGTLTYRYSHFSHSLDSAFRHVPVPLTRQYADMRLDAFGPTLARVYSPNNALADRLKHVIEPVFALQRTTTVENEDRVATTAGAVIVGDSTRLTYGLANRLLARKAPSDATGVTTASAPREILTVNLTQTYYSNQRASQFDYAYPLTYLYRPANSFSPVGVSVRSQPTTRTQVDFRLEYDPIALTEKLQGFSLDGRVSMAAVQATAGWSQRKFGSGSTIAPDNYLQSSATFTSPAKSLGITTSFNYDISRKSLIQHRWVGSYSAQCCGIAVEYQEHNFPGLDPRFPFPKDRRFNLSFTLAGIGTFSNFLGAFGAGSGRQY